MCIFISDRSPCKGNAKLLDYEAVDYLHGTQEVKSADWTLLSFSLYTPPLVFPPKQAPSGREGGASFSGRQQSTASHRVLEPVHT